MSNGTYCETTDWYAGSTDEDNHGNVHGDEAFALLGFDQAIEDYCEQGTQITDEKRLKGGWPVEFISRQVGNVIDSMALAEIACDITLWQTTPIASGSSSI